MRALVLDNDGFRYRGGALGDDVVYLAHPDYTVTDAANAVVDAELAEATDDGSTVAVTMEVRPRGDGDIPLAQVPLGSAVQAFDIDGNPTRYRFVGATLTEDGNGNPKWLVELNSLLEVDSARQQRTIDRLAPGAIGGRGQTSTTTDLGAGISFGELTHSELGQFNQTGYLQAELDPDDVEDPGHSPWWPIDEDRRLYRHPWVLQQASVEMDSIIVVRYREPDQTTIHTFGYRLKVGIAQPDDSDVAADNASFYTNLAVRKGGAVQMACTVADEFAYGLTWRTKYTSMV